MLNMDSIQQPVPSTSQSSIVKVAANHSDYPPTTTTPCSSSSSCSRMVSNQSTSTLAINSSSRSDADSVSTLRNPSTITLTRGPVVGSDVSWHEEKKHPHQNRLSQDTLSSCTCEAPGAPSEEWTRAKGFWRSFIALCLPSLLSALEGSVTNTALPTISESLDLGTKFTWVATAFLLASTIFQPLYSQIGDMWGRKLPMMIAVTIFAIGSAVCGCANSGAVLIFGRIVQGLGTGGIDLFSEMILCDIVPLRKRGPYLAIKHVVFAVGASLGPLLGGIFAEINWRLCFYVNIPVCAIAFAVIYFWLDVSGGRSMDASAWNSLKTVDYLGTGLLSFSVIMLLISLSTAGAPYSWSHPSIVTPMVFGLLGFIAFGFWQRSHYCKCPLMPPHVFSNRTTNISFALATIHGFITYGFQFYLSPFFQAVKGSSPSQSGIEVMPTTLGIVVCAAVGGPLITLWGKYKPIHIIGFALMTLGLGLCVLLGPETPLPAWLMFQIVLALGLGIVISTMLPAIQVKLPESSTAMATGSWAFLRGTGSLFGVAIPGNIFTARFNSLLSSISSKTARSQLAKGQAYQHASAAFVKKFGPEIEKEIANAFAESLKCIWITFTALAAIGFILTLAEKQHKMRTKLDTKYGLKVREEASPTPAMTLVPIFAASTSSSKSPNIM